MKKKIALDMLLNVVASAVPVFVLQLIILPLVSTRLGGEKYGLAVTIISMYNVISVATGNSLNNIRLVRGNTCETIPNYNVLLILLAIGNFFAINGMVIWYEQRISAISIVLNTLVATLWLLKEYYIVAFRICINYLYIVISNLVLGLGYLAGFLLFLYTNCWQLIYIMGLFFCLCFIFIKSELWKEPLKIDHNFKMITGQTLMLLVAAVLYRIPTYADKMIVYPLLGGVNTSILYVSTLFGKIVGMTITPVSGVLLSYLAKSKKKNNKSFLYALGMSCIVGVVGYIVCVLLSKPLLGYLYPNEIAEAMRYIPVTTATIVINAVITVVDPYILNYFDMNWQIKINLTNVIIYITLSLVLLNIMGLLGFCLGALITVILKLIFELLVFFNVESGARDSIS